MKRTRTSAQVRWEIEQLRAELERVIERENKGTVIVDRHKGGMLMERLITGTATFVTVDRATRVMEFDMSPVRDLDSELMTKFMTVYDLGKRDFRKVNLGTLRQIETPTRIYKIK